MVTRRQPHTVHAIPEFSDAQMQMQGRRRLPGTFIPTLGYSILTLAVFLLVSQLWLWSGRDSLEASSGSGSGVYDHQFMDKEQDLDSLRYQPTEYPESKVLPASTWSCTLEGDTSKGAKKSRQCVVQHVCVDDQGLFLLSQNKRPGDTLTTGPAFPDINLISSRESAEYYWKPRFKPIADVSSKMYYKHETVFVHGLFQPGHFSHYLYGGLLPLYSTMKRFNGTRSSWLLRQAEYLGENREDQAVWEMEAILPEGRELVLKSFEVVSDFQTLPPKDSASVPLCFERAVVGLGSQCGFSYCAWNTPTEIYLQYRDQIQEYYWRTTKRWSEYLGWREQQRAQEQRRGESMGRKPKSTETKTKVFSPTKCLETARYYGFEENESNDKNGLTTAEPVGRRGVRDPDMVDSQLQNRERPVVAIIERHGSRAVLNLNRVIQVIVQSKHFRVKVLSYDFGCGIPETAYLMRDVNILISPHGNALGGSLWMPSPLPSSRSQHDDRHGSYHDYPFPVVISIDTTKYSENWFQWTTTSMGQRFISHRCGPSVSYHPYPEEVNEIVCPLHRNMDLARASMQRVGLKLDKTTEHEDLLALTGAEYPLEVLERYNERLEEDGSGVNQFLSVYWKAIERYADPDRLLDLLELVRAQNILEDENHDGETKIKMVAPRRRKSYLDVCREGQCCGPVCEGVMQRNVVGELRAYDQDISADHWGEYLWSEEQNEFAHEGQSLRSWMSIN